MTTKVKGRYALIVYEKPQKQREKKSAAGSEDDQTLYDVLELSLIPKNHRVEGDTARVTWVDSTTKQKSCHYVTIKKISDNRDDLISMYPVDASTGDIASKETKIFTKEVLQNKKEVQVAKKSEKTARSVAQNKIEMTISKDSGLWTDLESTQSISPGDENLERPVHRISGSHAPSDRIRVKPTLSAASTSKASKLKYASTDHLRVKPTPPTTSVSESASLPEFASLPESAPLPGSTSSPESVPPPGSKSSPESVPSPGSTFLPESVPSENSSMSPKSVATDIDIVEGRYTKFWATMKDLAAVATPENISFLASVVASLKASTISPASAGSISLDRSPVYEITDRYKTPGKDKEPIFEGIDFYMFEGVKRAIQQKSYVIDKVTLKKERSWQLLVRSCLTEVYGSHLGEYSAKGAKDGGRPPIHQDLYRGLLYWSREWFGDHIDEVDFVNFINKTAYNKRKAQKQKRSEKFSEKSSSDQKERIETKNKKEKQKKKQQVDLLKETEQRQQSVEQDSESAPTQEHLSIPSTDQDQTTQKQPVHAKQSTENVPTSNALQPYASYYQNVWNLPRQNDQVPQNYQPPQHYQPPQNYEYSQNYPSSQNYYAYNQLQQYEIPQISFHDPSANKRSSTDKMEYEDL